MKKYLLLCLCILTVGLSSCKKETTFVPGDSSNRTILFDIFPEDWQPSADGLGYYREISVPENTPEFNQNGQIVAAMSFDDVNAYEGLPQVYAGVSYRFTAEPGLVTIMVSDPRPGVKTVRPNYDVTAKITLIDSQLID